MRLLAFAAVALTALAPRGAAAQPERATLMPQWEGRIDALLTPAPGAHAGAGVNVRAGHYARLGVAGAFGAVRARGDLQASRRVDATVRFLLDPFAERRRGLYGGAGLTLRSDGDRAWHGDLMLVVGVEGSTRARLVPAVELTLGGGVRLGIVLRGRRNAQSR